jgi:endonuclease-3
MTKKQRAELVQTELEKLYPEVPIPLDHTDPYTLMVAVALSAQTTDKKVNQVTPELFAVAGTPQRMAKLEEYQIKELIKEIGLPIPKPKILKEWQNCFWKDIME